MRSVRIVESGEWRIVGPRCWLGVIFCGEAWPASQPLP